MDLGIYLILGILILKRQLVNYIKYEIYTYYKSCTQYNGISAVEKNEIMPLAATWMDLEIAVLSDISQTEEKYRMASLIYGT